MWCRKTNDILYYFILHYLSPISSWDPGVNYKEHIFHYWWVCIFWPKYLIGWPSLTAAPGLLGIWDVHYSGRSVSTTCKISRVPASTVVDIIFFLHYYMKLCHKSSHILQVGSMVNLQYTHSIAPLLYHFGVKDEQIWIFRV